MVGVHCGRQKKERKEEWKGGRKEAKEVWKRGNVEEWKKSEENLYNSVQ